MNGKFWLLLIIPAFMGCERDFDIDLPQATPLLVVEGYINNELPLYNYVALSRSQDYYAPGFESLPVSGAMVTITEGELLPDFTYQWDASTRVQLKESKLPQLSGTFLPGVYFDTTLATDPAHALRGKPGKYYLLEVTAEKQHYTSITGVLPLIKVDSVTSGYHYLDIDEGDTTEKARLTVHYKDPDTIGNTQLYYWNHYNTRNNFGWGGFGTNRFAPGTDDLVNGQYIRLTHTNGFALTDSVNYFLISVDRDVYNFWDSYNKARNNDGPFATPVTLLTNMKGNNVTGCFSGFSVNARNIVVK
jgi:hypothetical protein